MKNRVVRVLGLLPEKFDDAPTKGRIEAKLIEQDFQRVIDEMEEQGYDLESWKVSTTSVLDFEKVGELVEGTTGAIAEKVIAVFKKRPLEVKYAV